MKVNKNSYTAASAYPGKILQHNKLLDSIQKTGKILPIHLQLAPTNRCQLNCSFCSCSKRDKQLELPLEDIKIILNKAKEAGCESITITGGGEPLLHPDIDHIIFHCYMLQIEVGLVTNGIAFCNLDEKKMKTLNGIKWCRVSFSDYRELDDIFLTGLMRALKFAPKCDWAFSYVLTAKPDYDKLAKIVQFANNNEFTHIRIVSDLLDLDNVPDMKRVKIELDKRNVDDSLVIYQGRKDFTPGTKDCLISLLKPVVAPNGYLYPCCGSQYAEKDPARDFGSDRMKLGKAVDIDKIIQNQKHFDGSVCEICYYSNYNEILKLLKAKLDHDRFV